MTDTEWTKEYIEHRDRLASDMPDYTDGSGLSSRDRHIWKYAFTEGFDEGATYERERAKVLIEALKSIYAAHERGCVDYKGCECWWQLAQQALAKYGEK